ncbi:MAG: hypothetical protein JXQ29_04420 [Planctomycetes bacterium]|nr:hypothetical protein [Planctomycetota bacterium]
MVRFMRATAVLTALICTTGSAQEDLKARAARVAAGLLEVEQLGGDHLGYAREALTILREGYGVWPEGAAAPHRTRALWRGRRPPEIDPLSLFSGGLAIRESLQLDRLDAFRAGGGAIDIGTLKPPATPSHPFEKMLEGRAWKASELARAVPVDFYYAIFHSMGGCLDFADWLDEVGGLVLRRYAPMAVDFRVKDKLLTQLALQVTPEARKFYDAVIDELVLTGSDPFLREGSDLTLVYKLKSSGIFRASVGLYRKYFEVAHGAAPARSVIGGLEASGLLTPDRTVHSWMLELADDVVAISSSETALARVVAAWEGDAPSLHAAADFRYMRSLYAADPEVEDGFLYLSDAFIRRMVGPELRIGEARRLAEAARIAALERRVLLYHQLHGRLPETVEAILADCERAEPAAALPPAVERLRSHRISQRLTEISPERDWEGALFDDWTMFEAELVYMLARREPDLDDVERWKRSRDELRKFVVELKRVYETVHGRPPGNPREALRLFQDEDRRNAAARYGLDAAAHFAGLELIADRFSVRSARYGRMGLFRPNLETPVETVSEAEADGYRGFVREYERYWRTYFDPIGIRLRRGDGRRIEVCILPLIQNSIYDSIRTLFGGQPVPITVQPLADEVFSLGLKLGKDAPPLGDLPFLEEMQRNLAEKLGMPDLDLAGLLGDSLEIHARDAEPLMDFDARGLLPQLLPMAGRTDELLGVAGGVFLAYAAFHPLRVAVGLRDEAGFEALLARLDEVLAAERAEREAGGETGFLEFGFDHYRFEHRGIPVRAIKWSFAAALHFRLFYAVLEGRLHVTTTESTMKALIEAGGTEEPAETVEGNVFLTLRPERLHRERPTFERTAMEAALAASLRNFGTIRLMAALFPGDNDLAGCCYRAFGFEPVSPGGGRYAFEPATGEVTDSAFGSRVSPRLEAEALRTATGMSRFFSTRQIRIVLKFTPEGIMTSVEIL